jgi:hypothetical protein
MTRCARHILFAAALAAFFAGCGRGAATKQTAGEQTNSLPGAEDAHAAEPVVRVRTRFLEVRQFEDVVTVPGQWHSAGDLVITAPFAAWVESLAVGVGDLVEPGRTLGWLETRESASALAGARLLIREARDDAASTEAQRALELALRGRVRVPLTAAVRGVVVQRLVPPGSQVAESAEILRVVPEDAVVFEARVPASIAPRLRPGQSARIDEEGQAVRKAVLRRVLPVTDAQDQTVLAWLAADAGGAGTNRPRLDHFGAAVIRLGPTRMALAVPDSAIFEDDLTGQKRVAVVSGDRAAWTPVTLGTGAAGWHEVVVAPGLAAGQRVIVEGQHGLPDSTRVRVAS